MEIIRRKDLWPRNRFIIAPAPEQHVPYVTFERERTDRYLDLTKNQDCLVYSQIRDDRSELFHCIGKQL